MFRPLAARITLISAVLLVSMTRGAVLFAAGAPISLKETYQSALSKNESVGIQKSLAEQSAERVSQAKGSILPSVSFIGSHLYQDLPENLAGSGGVSGAFAQQQQTNARFTAVQPLFRGLREFAGLSATQAQGRAQEALYQQSKLNLYGEVARAYFGVLQAEQDQKNLGTLLDLTAKRSAELEKRVKIGQSRKGELLTIQAQVASLRAQIESADAMVRQAREQLEFLAGIGKDSPLIEDRALPAKLPSLEDFVTRVERRPDIQAQRENVEAAYDLKQVAWGSHLPTLDATGNYYLKRQGVLRDAKWDVTLALTVPLFQGGTIQSQVRQASQAAQAQELALAQARRQAKRDIQTLYENATSGLSQISFLKQAVEASESNFREQSRDYRYGLVTNLDVLSSLNTFQTSKRDLDRVIFTTRSAIASLYAAVGEIQ